MVVWRNLETRIGLLDEQVMGLVDDAIRVSLGLVPL